MGRLRQSTAKIQELLDKIEQDGGAGLKYSTERTVYPTKLVHPGGVQDYEITEEQRAYNKETIESVDYPIISLYGIFLSTSSGGYSDGISWITFNCVQESEGELVSILLSIYSNGDAELTGKVFPLGGGNIDPELLEGYMPLSRDFSDDFNNDFTR